MRGNMRVPNIGDGGDRPFRANDHPTLVRQSRLKPVAEHLHGDKTVRPYAAHHAAEFVHVRIEHNARAGVSLLRDDRS